MKYRSVMGEGKITLIERAVEKEVALQAIMLQQAGPGEYSFERASVDKIAILRLDIEKISGKKSGYPD
jgi:nitroimidazol reductase NimA-like FMN-containing flavoprotein (pyridoxamine 5'-phosphate oxidase superfamily)